MVGGRVFWICLVTVLLLLANLASRSPSPTPRPGPIQRSLKAGSSSIELANSTKSHKDDEDENTSIDGMKLSELNELSLEEQQIIKKILENQDVRKISPKPSNRKPAPPQGPRDKSIFSFADFKIGSPSRAVDYGINKALVALNREFERKSKKSRADFADHGGGRRQTSFDPEEANTFNIAGGARVGTSLNTNQTKQILIATTWRSGSTFLGDLLNHYPGSFYYFEPLHYIYKHLDAKLPLDKISFLKSLYRCEFDANNLGYLHHVAQPANKFLFKNHNHRLWSSCSNLLPQETMCFMPDYLRAVCPLYPIKLIKTVRLRVSSARELLESADMNLKIVVLVRDPRGVFSSRSQGATASWCNSQKDCASPEVGCKHVLLDIQSARGLEADFPGRVLVLRYEDLSLNTEKVARSMLRFLELPWTSAISDYISTHTNKEKAVAVYNKRTKKMEKKVNPYTTTRKSAETAFKWRQNLSWGKIQNIQKYCSAAMSEMGYTLLRDKEETTSTNLPIHSTPNKIWPAWDWNL